MSQNDQQIEKHITYLLAKVHRKLHLDLEKILKQEGVQVEQWRILEILSDREGQIAGELAKLALMTPSALTKMIDRMVANGHVHRILDHIDQRKVHIHLTDYGQELLLRLQPLTELQNNNITNRLGHKKVQRLNILLEQLISNQ
ncbi:MAG: hypothetical protein OFPII_11970 [Osedax symbiont Rs1]|nr:MAG: hypothetical protein OFPII_11970 [Osedax symbiont Rs1]